MAYQLSQNFFAHAEHARIEDDRQMEIWHSSRLDAQRLHDVLPLRLSADELLEDGLELLVAGQLAEVMPRVPPDVLAAVRQLLAPLADHNLLRGGKYSNNLIVLSVSQYGDNYRVSHVLVDLGWVDFDFCVPPRCPAASAKLPSAQAESGEQWNTFNPSQQNPVSAHLGHPVETDRIPKQDLLYYGKMAAFLVQIWAQKIRPNVPETSGISFMAQIR